MKTCFDNVQIKPNIRGASRGAVIMDMLFASCLSSESVNIKTANHQTFKASRELHRFLRIARTYELDSLYHVTLTDVLVARLDEDVLRR